MVDGRREFLTREPIGGDLLSERLRHGPIPGEEALRLAVALGNAIAKVHNQGKVHGGLCPFCIVITEKGIGLVDPPSSPVDRAAYQSPEEYCGRRPDARSDIFAFGALVYEIVSGRRAFPYTGDELKEAILTKKPAPMRIKTTVDTAVIPVIAACLEKDPEKRRQRVANAAIELRMCRTIARTNEMILYRQSLPAGSQTRLLGSVPVPSAAARAAAPRAQTLMAPPPEVLVTEPAAASAARPAEAAAAPAPVAAAAPKPGPERPLGLRTGGWSQAVPEWRSAPAAASAPERLLSFAGVFSRRAWLVVGTLALTACSVAAVAILRGRTTQPVLQFSVSQPENTSFPGMPAVSPDGRYLAFSAVGQEGKRTLWLRPLDALRATMIPGTEGATAPFWSPDNQYVAFFAERWLKKVRISGGHAPETICAAEAAPGGGAWSKDGSILFAPSLADAFYRVPASGGKPEPVLKLDESRSEHGDLWPQFLPDGRHFIFYLQTDLTETSGVYTGSLDSREYKKLFSSQTNAVYSSGYLLYINERNLMAQPFDPVGLPARRAKMGMKMGVIGRQSRSLWQWIWRDRDPV